MNITFLIGNGFDISLGLKTSYSEFAKYYIQRPSSHPSIEELKRDIENDILHNKEKKWGSKWANFELAFGGYTTYISDNNEFDIVYDDIVNELRTYLSIENMRFTAMLTSNALNQKKLVDALIHPYNFIRNSKILSDFIQEEINSSINVRIINFNYTSTIDTLVKNIPWNSSEYKNMHVSIREVCHIHGSLDSTMLFGVNDISQIANKNFLNNSVVSSELVKPTFNKRLGYGIDDTCVSAIKNAHIVCVFGMSLGETDKYWWEEIGKSIQSPDQFAIFFMYDNKKYELTQEKLKLREEDRLKAKEVLPKIGCKMDPSIIDRIYIGYNTDLFQGVMDAKEN